MPDKQYLPIPEGPYRLQSNDDSLDATMAQLGVIYGPGKGSDWVADVGCLHEDGDGSGSLVRAECMRLSPDYALLLRAIVMGEAKVKRRRSSNGAAHFAIWLRSRDSEFYIGDSVGTDAFGNPALTDELRAALRKVVE